MRVIHRGPIVALYLPRSAQELMTYGKKVSAAMTGNPHFPSPSRLP